MPHRLSARTCCTTPSALCFFGAVFILLYGTGLLLASVWPVLDQYGDTLPLAALGAACLINFGKNRTLHCAITGPLFLLGAIAAGLVEAGVWGLDLRIVWGVVLLGVGAAFAIEWYAAGHPFVSSVP